MQNLYLYQMLYAEAVAIPYDRSAIGRTRAALYRIANLYGIPVEALSAKVREARPVLRKSAKNLQEQDQNKQAVATMGSIGTNLGWIASHIHAPVEDLNIPQLSVDLYSFLGLLAILDKLPTAKAE